MNFNYNINPNYPTLLWLRCMALFSLLSNRLTMLNIYKTRLAKRNSRHASWSAINSLIFHLSIADVVATGFSIIGETAWCYTVQRLANNLTFKLVKLFQMFSLYLSTCVLVLIGVDRWIAVKYSIELLNMAKRCYRLYTINTAEFATGREKMFQGTKLAWHTIKPMCQTNNQRLIHKAKMKSLRISVVIIFTFPICWTPYNVMMLIFMF